MTEHTETIELIDRAEIKDGQAIVAYTRTQAAVAELRQKYQGARYDLTTTAGDKAARAARLELVTLRGDLEKKRKQLKAPALEFGKKVDSEAARLAAEIVALEDPIDAQIKADEKRRDDERRAREEAEAARRKVHTDGIAKIAGYVALATELPSARIAAGITYLEGLDLSGFEEFTEEATATRTRTVEALRVLQVKAKAREDEAVRLEAERAEQSRIAAEQAETARKLREQQAEIERQRAELQAAQAEADRKEQEREAAARAEQQRQEQLALEQRQREEAAERERQRQILGMQQPAAYRQAGEEQSAANVVPMPTKAPAPAAVPTLKLGEINARLAPVSIDAAGLAALGLPHSATDKSAKLWHEHQFPAICDALIAHAARAKVKTRVGEAA